MTVKSSRMLGICLSSLLLCFVAIVSTAAEGRPDDVATSASQGATAITAANVYDHEQYWPNIVALAQDWTPRDADRPLAKTVQGVLVRVEPDAHVRVDFGRHGKYRVPIDVTDVVERANAVRAGTLHKTAPNFFLQIGTRLIDSRPEEVRAMSSSELALSDRFLVVFADPSVPAFWKLVDGLSALREGSVVQQIFVPQSVDRTDSQSIKDALRSKGWTVPYSYPRLSENYTRSLLGDPPTAAYVLLVTAEGRVLYQSELAKPGAFEEIREAMTPTRASRQ